MMYFEEFIMAEPRVQSMGVRLVADNPTGRRLASDGRELVTLTEPLTLQKGVNTKTYRATKAKPIKAWTMLWRLEGKERSTTNEKEQR
jgi:hypothetical protein